MRFNNDEKKCLYDIGLLWSINIKRNSSNLFRNFMYNRNKPINDSFVLCEKIENISTIISGVMLLTIYLFYSFLIIYLTSFFEASLCNNILLSFVILLFLAISCTMIFYVCKAIKSLSFLYRNRLYCKTLKCSPEKIKFFQSGYFCI
ncbi:membrane protein [Candidatus Magnetomorum sp. HK-1]|nr:membrane protein [Candidatus Magnetomorum sp. HK-1]